MFCDRRSDDIIQMLLKECEAGGVTRWQPCGVHQVRHSDQGFELDTDRGQVHAPQLVIATGGLAIPKIGATDFGYRLATQFGHKVVTTRPALVPLTFEAQAWTPWAALSGIALEVEIQTETTYPSLTGGKRKGAAAARFTEDLLFTHRGLSGPAVLQISSHWQQGKPIRINLTPSRELANLLKEAKNGSRKQLSTTWGQALGNDIPARLADTWLAEAAQQAPALTPQAAVAELKDKDLEWLGHSANDWQITPNGTEGYAKAEVTAGGVDTRELSSQTMESKLIPGLHFIGEVVDVTGWLGGYNFQWAWSSAMACARSLNAAA